MIWGGKSAGQNSWQWSGQTLAGQAAPDGPYTVNLVATDSQGNAVGLADQGEHLPHGHRLPAGTNGSSGYLMVGNSTVPLSSVIAVRQPQHLQHDVPERRPERAQLSGELVGHERQQRPPVSNAPGAPDGSAWGGVGGRAGRPGSGGDGMVPGPQAQGIRAMAILSAMYSGVSGLTSQGEALSTVADNIANMNTDGFKGSRVNFGDIMVHDLGGGLSTQIGTGSMVLDTQAAMTQGTLDAPGVSTDMAINGQGFFGCARLAPPPPIRRRLQRHPVLHPRRPVPLGQAGLPGQRFRPAAAGLQR